jgi:hypothetical protein
VIIRRASRKRHYTNVDNAIFEAGLSLEALGELTYLLSRPDNWHVHLGQLARHFRIGRERNQRIMRELMDAGFAKRQRQTRSEDGRGFGPIEYVIMEDRTAGDEASAATDGSKTCSLETRPHVQPENVRAENPTAYLLLTPPITDVERAWFDRLDAEWPSASDNRSDAWSVFKTLSEEEQIKAVELQSLWRERVTKEGRKILPTLANYLRRRLWKRLPTAAAHKSAKATVWITEDDQRWSDLAQRHERELGRPVLAMGSRHDPGIGARFPSEWVQGEHSSQSTGVGV